MNEKEIQNAIAALEAQRGLLPDDVIQTSLAALRNQLATPPPTRTRGLLYAALSSNLNLTDSATTRSLRQLYELQLRLKSIATEHGGVLSSRSTYNVLATFDAPTAADVVFKTVGAALAIRRELQTSASDRTSVNPYVQIGLHLTTDDITLEEFGRADSPDLHILEMLTDAAAPNQILGSYALYREGRTDFSIYFGKSMPSEEMGDKLRMYVVTGPRADTGLQRADEQLGLRTIMIGRRAELDFLQKALRACMGERSRQVIHIVGEAGMGKTRLLEEFQHWLHMIPESVWYFKGHATPSTRHQPYGLVRDILIRRFEIGPHDSYLDAYDKLTQGITEVLGEDALPRAHLIAQLVGLDFSTNTVSASDNVYMRDEAVSALLEFFVSMFATYRDPLVIVLEHIQWADEASYSFLQQLLLDARQPMPILVLMTARTAAEEVPPLWYQDSTFSNQTLALDPLSIDLTTLLISEVMRNMVELPQHLLTAILANTRGNPRHILELLRNLLDSEVIIQSADGWKLDDVAFIDYAEFTMPQLAQARLSRLSETAQQLVVCAAIIGDVFWDKAVRHMAQVVDDEAYLAGMRDLVDDVVIYAHTTSNFPDAIEYQFTNGLLQRYLYEITPLPMRQHYHARFASWLIGQGMNRVAQYAGVIAQNYQQAQDLPRAIKWHLLAARQAEQTFSPRTAIYHFEQTIVLARHNPDKFQSQFVAALMGLSTIYGYQARYLEALDVLNQVLETAPHTIDAPVALVEMSRIYNRFGHPHDALASAQRALLLFEALGEEQHEQVGMAWLNISRAHRRLSNHDEALKHAEQALQFPQAVKSDTLMADTFNVLGTIYLSSAKNAEMAMVFFNKALETARRQGNLTLVAQLSNNIAESARLRGDFQSALVMYRKTEEAAQRIGNQQVVITSIMNTGAAWLGLQKHGKAAEAVQRALAMLSNQPESEQYCESLWLYGTALLGMHQFSEALEVLLQAHRLALHLDQPAQIGAAWRSLGMWCAAQRLPIEVNNRSYDAIACFEQSYDMLDRSDLLLDKAYTLRAWGFHLIDLGQLPQAIAMWQEAIDLMGQSDATYEQETLQGILDDLLQQGGQQGIDES